MKVRYSILRDDLTVLKTISHDTGWRQDDMKPRFGPYPQTRPAAPGWEWRSLSLSSKDGRAWRLLLQVSPRLGKWKAMLIRIDDGGQPVAIMRYEDQPGEHGGGLHIHTNCDEKRDVTGAESVQMTYTLPEHRKYRRRRTSWTKPLFCQNAGAFFRTSPINDQEEWTL